MENIHNFEKAKKDFSAFQFNNFKKTDGNIILNSLEEKGYAIWLNGKGNICIRTTLEGEYKELTITKASLVLSNLLAQQVKIETTKSFDETKGEENTIHISELLLVDDEVFNIEETQEFYKKDGSWYLNTFKPSKYLMLSVNLYKEPKTILQLIFHLVNYDQARFEYFLNWLASFFQTLDKSQVAILFKGVQGAGKGTFFKIIQRLFGEVYCKEINGDSLKSNYLGSFIEDTLFVNFDEISYQTIGKSSFNNFLKALITNDSITAEKKNIDLKKSTKLYAQTILFSNAESPIEIEPSDRRFTVFTTGNNLVNTNFLGYGSYLKLEQAIMNELEDFALYLKSYAVNFEQANMVFNTPEKDAMMDKSENSLYQFANAIMSKNFQYFQILQMRDIVFYNEFVKHLAQNKFKQKHLILAFRMLNPYDRTIRSSRILLKHLEEIDPYIFGESNVHKSNGEKFYHLTY
ncbi:MAG: hypothetical protein JW802_07735 [Campylobacterales bacterium]|nr:hypothetical protein [Campylobacterales bacterium]MBN2833127.1 hypothetical protein [Campylobacterales bacterium]